MAKKDYFLIIDTETTQNDQVADFAAIIVDRKGNIHNQCAVLTHGIFNDRENHPLFVDNSNPIWNLDSRNRRYEAYNNMLNNGTRMLASVGAINIWLGKANAKYKPILTAYNISFDADKCAKTGIDLTIFEDKFCLWHSAFSKWAHTRAYRQFALDVHAFNSPTKLGNMSFKTNAETMARFVLGNPRLEDEPHTALEDIIYYELPILIKLVNNSKRQDWMNPNPFNWKNVQVRDWFKAK